MALTREQKEEEVARLTELFSADQTITFVTFDRLTVDDVDNVRAGLREADIQMNVVKKTLAHRALDAAGIEGDRPETPGQLAVVYGPGKTAPAREIYSFQTELEEAHIEIVGGIFENTYKSQEEMVEIAQIPGLDELRGMFANVISSPISGFAVALSQVAEKKEA